MNCVVCNEPTKPIYDQQYDLNYYVCDHCGFIAQDRQTVPTFSEERVEYDHHENSIDNEGYVNYFKAFIDAAVIPYASLGKGLDYGSGPEPVFSQVMARDYGAKMDIYDLHYQPDPIYKDQRYDYITSTEVIEHVNDPVAFLRNLYDHLKEGGVICLMTLFHPEDSEAFLKWWYRRDITHISFFTPGTFEFMAKKIGLEVEYCDNKRYITLKKQ